MGLYVLKFPTRRILLPLARKLHRVHPDTISYAATAAALASAFCYPYAQNHRWLLIAAVILILLRMMMNTLDGVMAIERGNLSLKGEIVNALPDRYSDLFLLLGISFSPLCSTFLGVLAMASMFLVSYTGMLGKALGVNWQHHGPLGKVERLILIMIFSLMQYFTLADGDGRWNGLGARWTPLEWCMILFVLLGAATIWNRLQGMLRQIVVLEWMQKQQDLPPAGKVLVVYDSHTGNTETIARKIAESMHAETRRADEAAETAAYELVVICTPNIRAYPTEKITAFLRREAAHIKQYALCVTYGMPIWGPIATQKLKTSVKTLVGKSPLSVFVCKGYHKKYKTYKGRPNQQDQENASLFGIQLAKRLFM
jgi:archaetidylinositol phosphate synthase